MTAIAAKAKANSRSRGRAPTLSRSGPPAAQDGWGVAAGRGSAQGVQCIMKERSPGKLDLRAGGAFAVLDRCSLRDGDAGGGKQGWRVGERLRPPDSGWLTWFLKLWPWRLAHRGKLPLSMNDDFSPRRQPK